MQQQQQIQAKTAAATSPPPSSSSLWITAILVSVVAGILVIALGIFCGYYGYRVSKLVHSLKDDSSSSCCCDERRASAGDILLYSIDLGSSFANGLSGAATMIRTNSPWTHVGLVVQNPQNEQLYTVEFTLEDNDALSGGAGTGINIMPLQSRVDLYQGKVYSRRLMLSSSAPPQKKGKKDKLPSTAAAAATTQMIAQLWDETMKLLHMPHKKIYKFTFITDIWHRIGIPFLPALNLPTPLADADNAEATAATASAWICTDIVAHLLHKVGVFTQFIPCMLPHDFASATERMPLNPNYMYSAREERVVVVSSAAAATATS